MIEIRGFWAPPRLWSDRGTLYLHIQTVRKSDTFSLSVYPDVLHHGVRQASRPQLSELA